MTPLTTEEARTLLGDAFAKLLDPYEQVENVSDYYAESCIQEVDGVRIDHPQFLDHARALKQSVRKGRVTFEALIAEGMTDAAMYVLDMEDANGETARLKVIAFVTPEDGGIVSLAELTHVLRLDDASVPNELLG